ncbi:MAG: hypothetical protein DMG17_33765, partial [Acidobacteria bacterium]
MRERYTQPVTKLISQARWSVGTAVVENLVLEPMQIPLRLLDSVIRRESVEQPISAAQNRSVIQAEVYSQARGKVALVVWQITRQPRQEADLLRVRIAIDVVSHTEIERHIVPDLPIVLDPAGKEMPDDPVSVLRIRRTVVDPPGDGGQGRQIPCGCVVPNWEERLEIGWWRCSIGDNYAITPQTP